jgi:hypothetical protein
MGRLWAGSDKTEIRTFIHIPRPGDAGRLAQALAFTNPSSLPPNIPDCCHPKGPLMSIDTPAALSAEPVETTAEAAPPIAQWGEMALTVMFTLAAVLFVSFLAVVTGLV